MSVGTSVPQETAGFIIKRYFGILNIFASRYKPFSVDLLANNRCPIIFHAVKAYVPY